MCEISSEVMQNASDFIPKEALSCVAETELKCKALWSVNKNQIGVHLTLFWPTQISDENSEKLAKLTDEERKFITQNPALLEFILNQKRLEKGEPGVKEHLCETHCETPPMKREAGSCCPAETPPPPKVPKLETDSGMNSVTSNSPKEKKGQPTEPAKETDKCCETKSINEEEVDDPDPDQEVKSEEAAELIETTPNPPPLLPPGFPALNPGLNPRLPHMRFLAAQNASATPPNPFFAGLQNQIIQAAIQRQKQVEEEQKARLQQLHPAFRPNLPMFPFAQNPNPGSPLVPPPNPGLEAARAILSNQTRLRAVNPSPNHGGLDVGLPREGEAVFRDKYIWSESVKKYLCSVCGYSTPYRSNIIVHLPKHYPELRRFRCPVCHKKYGRKDLWKSHLRSRHPEVADFVLTPSWHSNRRPQAALPGPASVLDDASK